MMRMSRSGRASSGRLPASCATRSSPRSCRSLRKFGSDEKTPDKSKACAAGNSSRRHGEGNGGTVEGKDWQGAFRQSREEPGNGRAREHHEEAYAAESVKERSGRNYRQGSSYSYFERDADLSGMRQIGTSWWSRAR